MSLLLCLLVALLPDLQIVIHILLGADKDGRSLVDAGWLDVQDGFDATRGFAPGLFDDVGHRTALVQQSQLMEQVGGMRYMTLCIQVSVK